MLEHQISEMKNPNCRGKKSEPEEAPRDVKTPGKPPPVLVDLTRDDNDDMIAEWNRNSANMTYLLNDQINIGPVINLIHDNWNIQPKSFSPTGESGATRGLGPDWDVGGKKKIITDWGKAVPKKKKKKKSKAEKKQSEKQQPKSGKEQCEPERKKSKCGKEKTEPEKKQPKSERKEPKAIEPKETDSGQHHLLPKDMRMKYYGYRRDRKGRQVLEHQRYPRRFVPVTKDVLDIPLEILRAHGNCTIVEVHHRMFLDRELTLKFIREEYEPILGHIEYFQVFRKIVARKFCKSLRSPYVKLFTECKKCYILANRDKKVVEERATIHNSRWRFAEKDEVIKDLRKGEIAMYGHVLYKD